MGSPPGTRQTEETGSMKDVRLQGVADTMAMGCACCPGLTRGLASAGCYYARVTLGFT